MNTGKNVKCAPVLSALALMILWLTSCARVERVEIVREWGESAALFGQFRAYDSATGRELTFDDVVHRARRADVVFFGEEHSNQVCNALEAQLLRALHERGRPVTLAMEFFERDTQSALDAYLDGQLKEAEFRTLARQKRAYLTAHRPLIEYCRYAGIPVVAANAPARLVKEFRTSGLGYDEFRSSLEPSDRMWLPATSEMLEGAYYDRFVEVMSSHPEPTTAPAEATPAALEETKSEGATEAAPDSESDESTDVASQGDLLMEFIEPGRIVKDALGYQPVPDESSGLVLVQEDGVYRAVPAPSEDAPDAGDAASASDTTGREGLQATMQPDHGSHSHGVHASGEDGERTRHGGRGEDASGAGVAASGAASQPSEEDRLLRSYRVQLLWDDSMSEAVASHRARYPERQVMLIVGAFHVEREGGTLAKYRERPPDDRVLSIVYRGTPDTSLVFDEDDRGAGDIVIYGITPPEPESGE